MNQSVLVNGATGCSGAEASGRFVANGELVIRRDKLNSTVGTTTPHCGTARNRRCDAGS